MNEWEETVRQAMTAVHTVDELIVDGQRFEQPGLPL